MSEVTYYFNSKSSSVWTDSAKMIDNILTNYATTSSTADTETLNGNTAHHINSYSESNYNSGFKLYSTDKNGVGQSFTAKGSTLRSCKFYLKKYGSPTGNAVAKIYNETHVTAYGTDSKPTGAALATSDTLDVSTLTTSYQLIEFSFSGANQIALTDGAYYVVVIEYDGGGFDDYILVGGDTSSPTHSGNYSYTLNLTDWTSSSAYDLIFYVYAHDNLGTISKVELRAYGYGDGGDRIDLIPIFSGGDGDTHQTTPANGTPGWGTYVDITNDTNHPDWSSWSHVHNLDCKVKYTKDGKSNTMYCAKVEIRVTYTPSAPPAVAGSLPINMDVGSHLQSKIIFARKLKLGMEG